MTILDVVGRYYDAWANKKGDFSGVPLADDFTFRGRWPISMTPQATGRWQRKPGR